MIADVALSQRTKDVRAALGKELETVRKIAEIDPERGFTNLADACRQIDALLAKSGVRERIGTHWNFYKKEEGSGPITRPILEAAEKVFKTNGNPLTDVYDTMMGDAKKDPTERSQPDEGSSQYVRVLAYRVAATVAWGNKEVPPVVTKQVESTLRASLSFIQLQERMHNLHAGVVLAFAEADSFPDDVYTLYASKKDPGNRIWGYTSNADPGFILGSNGLKIADTDWTGVGIARTACWGSGDVLGNIVTLLPGVGPRTVLPQ